MLVVVVGGSGRIGQLVVSALLEAGDTVVATIRNPNHAPRLQARGVQVSIIDLESSPTVDIERSFSGTDAIVFVAGATEGDLASNVDRGGVKRTVAAAVKAGGRRYVAIS